VVDYSRYRKRRAGRLPRGARRETVPDFLKFIVSPAKARMRASFASREAW
jgi:hypothetical protein